jgi:hypothetical protein
MERDFANGTKSLMVMDTPAQFPSVSSDWTDP